MQKFGLDGNFDRVLGYTEIEALGFVPYTGATKALDMGDYGIKVSGIIDNRVPASGVEIPILTVGNNIIEGMFYENTGFITNLNFRASGNMFFSSRSGALEFQGTQAFGGANVWAIYGDIRIRDVLAVEDYLSDAGTMGRVGDKSIDVNLRQLYANAGSDLILDWNVIGLADFQDTNLTTTGDVTVGGSVLASTGTLTLGGVGGTYNNSITYDFEDSAATVKVTTADNYWLTSTGGSVILDSRYNGIQLRQNGNLVVNLFPNFNYGQSAWGVHSSNSGNQLILTNSDWAVQDYDHTNQTNPTFYVHSNIAPNTDNTQWLSLTHDQTNGVIDCGTALISFVDNNLTTSGDIRIVSDANQLELGDVAGGDMVVKYDGTDGLIDTSIVAPSDLNIACGTDKTLELTETVWKDINLSSANLQQPASSAPSIDTFLDENGADTDIATFAFGVGDKIGGTFEIQHDYKDGSDFVFHIHFQADVAPSGTDNVAWELDYTVVRDGSTMDATTNISTGDIVVDTQYQQYLDNWANITGTNFLNGDHISFKLTRVAAVGDAYTGDVKIKTVGMHYQVNTMGSRQPTIK